MNGQSQQELQTDEELVTLSDQHHQLDDRLNELTSKPYRSEPEHIEEVNIKKQKLLLKDRMEDILRRRQQAGSQGFASG